MMTPIDIRAEFHKAIYVALKIEQNIFSMSAVESALVGVEDEDLLQLFQYTLSVEAYGNGLKAFTNAVEKLKNEKKEELFSKTRATAEQMYTKFYTQSCQMFDYLRLNRGLNPVDRDFFYGQNFENLKNKNGEKTFTKQELYVLKALGAGQFLMHISYYLSKKDVIDKIENVIQNGLAQKYLLSKSQKTLENEEKNEEIEIYNQSVIGLLKPQKVGA